MQLTDWLVVVFIVAIVVVMLDGVRRKLQERRNRVVLKIDRNLPGEDFDEAILSSAELPNGGARTLPRNGQPAPTLRNLKTSRKSAAGPPARDSGNDDSQTPVPVLMDAVELEEERIEHTNVFADTGTSASFEADDFTEFHQFNDFDDSNDEDWNNAAADREDDEYDEDEEGFDEGFEEDYEEVAPMLREEPVARSRQVSGMETRYQGRDDDDDYDDEELADDDFDDDSDDFDEELSVPEDLDDDEDDTEDDDDLDDDYDEDDDDEDEDDLDEDEDIDELGGYPEDDWGIEEEQDLLVDDYENEPVLLQDTYNKAASHFSRSSQQPRIEPGFGDGDTFDEEALDEDFSAAQTDRLDMHSDTLEPMRPPPPARRTTAAPEPAATAAPADTSPARPTRPNPREAFSEENQGEESRVVENRVLESRDGEGRVKAASTRPEPEPADTGPQEVIIINVMARPGHMLKGSELLPVLQQQGLRLGDMSIFHRHTDPQGNGPAVFSMANMVKPGTFDLGSMETFMTPGVSLFLQMPNRIGNMAAFDMMLGTASALRNALGAELKDENRSVFTRQTVEHCRQRVGDFELALLSRKQDR